jgi:hypothetical protein
MHFLFTDETNQRPSAAARFFIYGGLFIPAEGLQDLHELVQRARDDNGYVATDEFKFSASSKPPQVTAAQFKSAKRAVLQGCAPLGIQLAACLTLHEIAKNRTLQELVTWGANTIIGAFHRFLEESGSNGACIVDRLPFDSGYRYLQEKFRVGLTFPDGDAMLLKRILLFASTCEGASHASSAVDIILGSFRYCVNEREKSIAPKEMLPAIASMMWHRRGGNRIYLRERGLIFRPKAVKVPEYQGEYDDLIDRFRRLLA